MEYGIILFVWRNIYNKNEAIPSINKGEDILDKLSTEEEINLYLNVEEGED